MMGVLASLGLSRSIKFGRIRDHHSHFLSVQFLGALAVEFSVSKGTFCKTKINPLHMFQAVRQTKVFWASPKLIEKSI